MGGHVRAYLREPYPHLKEAVVEALREQDAGRGAPAFEHYDCTYLFLYPEEEVFVTGLGARAGLAKSGGDAADEVYRQRDISNRIKLIEDALFSYFGCNDTRTFDLHAHKRAVRKLPFSPARFSENIFGREVAGVLLIAVRESPGPLLQATDPLCQTFKPVLGSSMQLLDQPTAVVASRFPEWFDAAAIPERPSIHVVEDARAVASCSGVWAKTAERQRMLGARVRWLSELAARDMDWAASCLFEERLLKRAWRKLAKQRTVLRPEEQATFDASWEWAYKGLADECRSDVLRWVMFLRDLALAAEQALSVLIVGPGVGTFAYPFLAARSAVTVVSKDSAEESVFLARLEQDQYQCQLVRVDDWERGFDVGDARFDVVVCFGLLERVADREGALLRSLAAACGKRLLLTASFQQRPGRKRSGAIEYPWVFADSVDEKPRREWITHYLTGTRAAVFKKTPGTDFRGQVLDLTRAAN